MQTPLVPIIENMLTRWPAPENEPPIPEIMHVKGCLICTPKGPTLIFLLFCRHGVHLFQARITLIANGVNVVPQKVVRIEHNHLFGEENVRETDPIFLTPNQYDALLADENRQIEISWGGSLSSNGPRKITITHPFFMDG